MDAIEISKIIRERYSPRIFTERMPDEASLTKLFEAARWAASSRNSQPWRFIYGVYQSENWRKLLSCLSDSNQYWAKNAPVLILGFIKTMDPVFGTKLSKGEYALGLAVGNLSLQAGLLGLGLRNMGGFDLEQARKAFSIPEHFLPQVMLALGFPGNPHTSDDQLKVPIGNERHRRTLEQIIFNGEWEKME